MGSMLTWSIKNHWQHCIEIKIQVSKMLRLFCFWQRTSILIIDGYETAQSSIRNTQRQFCCFMTASLSNARLCFFSLNAKVIKIEIFCVCKSSVCLSYEMNCLVISTNITKYKLHTQQQTDKLNMNVSNRVCSFGDCSRLLLRWLKF